MSVSTQQRREKILSDVFESGRVIVKTLAEELDVSEATIRRDLRALSSDAKVELVYGGATLPRMSDFSFRTKSTRNVDEKRIVGRIASEAVLDGDLIYLDSGTTCFEMVPYLKSRQGLTVIVNSARLTMEFDSTDVQVILLGGQYRPDRMDTTGPLAIEALNQLRGYKAFIGADGLDMEFGLTASDMDSAYLHKQAIANARDSVLVADHSKFLSPSLYKIETFSPVSAVFTDRRPNEEWMQFFETRGIEVHYPNNEVETEQL